MGEVLSGYKLDVGAHNDRDLKHFSEITMSSTSCGLGGGWAGGTSDLEHMDVDVVGTHVGGTHWGAGSPKSVRE